MQRLSLRAQRELALLHATDALRVLAAVAVPLHVLPLGCVLYAVLYADWTLMCVFCGWAALAVFLHAAMIRSAENLLEKSQSAMQIALSCGSLLLLIMLGSQVMLSLYYGIGLVLVILIVCGLFDLMTLAALTYAFWSCIRTLTLPDEVQSSRHIGFEVMFPEAEPRDER